MEMLSLTGLMDLIDRALTAVSEGLSFDSCVYNVEKGGGVVFLTEASAPCHSDHHHLFSPG